jgi:hypothetical protein
MKSAIVLLLLNSISGLKPPKIERREPHRGSSKSYFRYDVTNVSGMFNVYGQ